MAHHNHLKKRDLTWPIIITKDLVTSAGSGTKVLKLVITVPEKGEPVRSYEVTYSLNRFSYQTSNLDDALVRYNGLPDGKIQVVHRVR